MKLNKIFAISTEGRALQVFSSFSITSLYMYIFNLSIYVSYDIY